MSIPAGMQPHPIQIEHLGHAYGKHAVYQDLSLTFGAGKIYGLLGKNGVGKTTLIKILMGFLKPRKGVCRIFGDPAYAIRPQTRERVGLLFERHLTYDFFTISQIERFMAPFYPRWK
ncbi:MAG: ATP-binding cassette domain-containing protein, partial [Desulfovibrionaceae bacterium]|nr:ATP-binding cassette domain-containing protein [Desulfovibrionaceae bacterium]